MRATVTDDFGNKSTDISNGYFILGEPDGDINLNYISEEDKSVLVDWSWIENQVISITDEAIASISNYDYITIYDDQGINTDYCNEDDGTVTTGLVELATIDISEEINNVDALIIENLKDALSDYLTSFKYNWFRGWQGYTGIKFNRYFPGQGMKEHWDNIHSIFDGEKKGIPILTCIGVLNDDYEGGDLMICQDKIETKKGDLLIFPSSFMYPHEVMPVTEGVRYSWISWAY